MELVTTRYKNVGSPHEARARKYFEKKLRVDLIHNHKTPNFSAEDSDTKTKYYHDGSKFPKMTPKVVSSEKVPVPLADCEYVKEFKTGKVTMAFMVGWNGACKKCTLTCDYNRTEGK